MGRLALAEQRELDEGVLVDRRRERLSHAHIVEGRALVVEDHAVPGRGCDAVGAHVRVVLELVDRFVGKVPEDVDRPGFERREPRRRFGDDAHRHGVELRQSLARNSLDFSRVPGGLPATRT